MLAREGARCHVLTCCRMSVPDAHSQRLRATVRADAIRRRLLELQRVRDTARAIAAALSDMDAGLSALDAGRDKTRALKQAMMQELLTGRTRLV